MKSCSSSGTSFSVQVNHVESLIMFLRKTLPNCKLNVIAKLAAGYSCLVRMLCVLQGMITWFALAGAKN